MSAYIFFRVSFLFLLIVATFAILFQSDVYAKLSKQDADEFFKAQENMKIMGQLGESCQIQSSDDLDTFEDCIRIISSFNLKMTEIREEYGTIIDKYIQ